jgi:TonB family protein
MRIPSDGPRAGRRIFAAVFLAAIAGDPWASLASQSAAEWKVVQRHSECSLIRLAGGPPLKLTSYPDIVDAGISIAEIGEPKLLSRSGNAKLSILPAGRQVSGEAYPPSRFPERRDGVVFLPEEKIPFAEFAGADRVSLIVRDQTIASISLTSIDAALAALHACNRNLLRLAGVDLDVLATLRKPPAPIGGGTAGKWFTNGDYPREAVMQRKFGNALVSFTVGTDGRAKDCAVAGSSGHEVLDRPSCAIILRRGRFSPALDAEGRPIDTKMVAIVRWTLPAR